MAPKILEYRFVYCDSELKNVRKILDITAIIIAVTFSGHGLNHTVLRKLIPVKLVLVLPALIRVHNQSLHRRKTLKRLRQHILDLLQVWAEGKIIRNDLVCVHVQNRREIAFAPGKIELRNIGCPLLQRPLCTEISIDDISSNFANFALIRMIFFFRALPQQAQLVHDPLNAFMIDLMTAAQKRPMHPPYTVSSLVFGKNGRYFCG